MTDAPSPTQPAVAYAGHDARTRTGWVFAVIAVGAFMAQLDLFIVNIAFPAIEQSFPGSTPSSLSWVLNAYAIVFAACLVPAGRLADLLGRRQDVPARADRLRGRLGGLRAGADARRARRRPRRPGGRRRAAHPHLARAAAARVPARPAGRCDRRLGRRRRGRGRRRPGPRRPARRGELEADLPRQHPARRSRALIGSWLVLDEVRHPEEGGLPDLAGIALLIAGIGGVTLAIVEGPQWGWTSAASLATLAASRRSPSRRSSGAAATTARRSSSCRCCARGRSRSRTS